MRKSLFVCLGLVLAACSDSGGSVDKGPTPDIGATDKSPVPDQGPTVDKPVSVDKPVVKDTGPDHKPPRINTATHTGWRKTSCAVTGCHPATIPGHTATRPPECATCHGGNGACNPNGKNSTKQNHNATSTCSICHGAGGKHGFTATADCAACHFATAGLLDCP